MYNILSGAKSPIKVWAPLHEVESEALDQLRKTANLPWVEAVAAMPDVHYGLGATVGSVVKSRGAVSPSVVGVDIGCGMIAVKTPYTSNALGDNLKELRHSIERSVPVGFNSNKSVSARMSNYWDSLGAPSERAAALKERCLHQLGSLGGGNHFIEVCLDAHDTVWIMLHSGSRHLGKALAEQHINTAKGLMADLIKRDGIDSELAALVQGTPEYDAYILDLMYAQEFAKANRAEMMLRVLKDLSHHIFKCDVGKDAMAKLVVNCHHNYIEVLDDGALLTRKGAVSARDGEFGIIPGSMGARSFIVKGKGSADSFCSCSHGAGRRMSRGKAKRTFTVADLEQQTAGVECRKDAGVLDEIPGAYKDVEQVMRNQADLVSVYATLRQVVCVKG